MAQTLLMLAQLTFFTSNTMTHRIEVNVQTGEVNQIEYTAEEQAEYDAAIAQQQAEMSTESDIVPTEPTA